MEIYAIMRKKSIFIAFITSSVNPIYTRKAEIIPSIVLGSGCPQGACLLGGSNTGKSPTWTWMWD